MKNFLCSVMLFAAALCTTQVCGAAGFKVTPWAIYDPDGNEFLAKGADVSGPGLWWPGKVINDTDKLLNCWKFNLMRVCISYNGALGDHNTLDEIVNYFTPKKIVVVIATTDNPTAHWTDAQFNSPTGAYQTWLKNTASKYKDNPYVWYSVVGENGTCNDCTYDQWVPSNQQLLKVVRDDAGATNIFQTLGSTWGQEAGCTSGNVPTAKSCFLTWGDQLRFFNGKNYAGQGILYEIHPYEQWDSDGEARLDNFIDRNQAMGNYLLLNDYAGANGSVAPCKNTLLSVIAVAQKRKLALGGMWYWTGDPGNTDNLCCLCSPGCSSGATVNSCTNPTNLTWMGQIIWNNSHRDETLYPSNFRDPYPAHSDSGVGTNVTLKWTAVANVTSYDVYFGTSNTPGQSQFVGNQTTTTYKPSNLQPNTKYYWRVSPKNQNGTTMGGVMYFKTGTGTFSPTSGRPFVHKAGFYLNGMGGRELFLTTPSTGTHCVRLVKSNGSLVKIWNGRGPQTYHLFYDAYAPSVYMVYASAGEAVFMQRVVVLK